MRTESSAHGHSHTRGLYPWPTFSLLANLSHVQPHGVEAGLFNGGMDDIIHPPSLEKSGRCQRQSARVRERHCFSPFGLGVTCPGFVLDTLLHSLSSVKPVHRISTRAVERPGEPYERSLLLRLSLRMINLHGGILRSLCSMTSYPCRFSRS